MIEWIQWVITHKVDLIQIYIGTVGVASIIIKLTPTVKDDTILKKILKITGRYISLNRK